MKDKGVDFSNIPMDFVKEVRKEREDFIKSVQKYKLPTILEEASRPLTLKEKRALKNYKLENLEFVDDKDALMVDLLELREVKEEDYEPLDYNDLLMWLHRVLISTFEVKEIATKK